MRGPALRGKTEIIVKCVTDWSRAGEIKTCATDIQNLPGSKVSPVCKQNPVSVDAQYMIANVPTIIQREIAVVPHIDQCGFLCCRAQFDRQHAVFIQFVTTGGINAAGKAHMSVRLAYGKLDKRGTCRSDLPVLPAKSASAAMQCLAVMVIAIKVVAGPVDHRRATTNAIDHRAGNGTMMCRVGQIILQTLKAQHER